MKYTSSVSWFLSDEKSKFTSGKYSRLHKWAFDGGIEVNASSSPSIVPLPYSIEEAVDPEEAFIASVSSCHMLWFLSIAAKEGLIVLSYHDKAEGTMSKNQNGLLFISHIVLMPRVVFDIEVEKSVIDSLHEKAHLHCFIANSILTEITVESRY
jgi:organic hydroperoxide reductase OsmC/OhrA